MSENSITFTEEEVRAIRDAMARLWSLDDDVRGYPYYELRGLRYYGHPAGFHDPIWQRVYDKTIGIWEKQA